MEHLYSVTPLLSDHFDERVADVVSQYKRKITSCPLFMMVLIPEGNPVWNKAEPLCNLYARYRDALLKEGVPSGILVQATFGHGNSVKAPAPFQKMIGFNNGVEQPVYCPMDERTVAYLSAAMKRIAMEHPKVIMLDDDVRLMMRPFEGCACPMHMREFNRINKTDMTREELYSYVMAHPDSDSLTRSYVDLQRNTLVNAVTAFREAIDSVDPSIQGINCTSGDECDAVWLTNPVFAGKGNPTVVRVPNGTYSPLTTKFFSDTMRRAAVTRSKLKKHGIDIVLAETDTVPFNRYSKNARYLHSHFSASILEGLRGAKHWITRTKGYEPKSGAAFRNILAKHAGFYDELARVSEGIRFVGACSAFIEQRDHKFHVKNPTEIWRYHDNAFADSVLERMGIPFYYSDGREKAVFLEDRIVRDMNDEELSVALSGSVFCSVEAAEDIIARGFGHILGVTVREYKGGIVSGESYGESTVCLSAAEKGRKELVIENSEVKPLSYCYRNTDSGIQRLFPAVTLYKREDGNISVVFCGIPKTEFKYTEAFSFLNESRKAQLVSCLKEAGALPIYCESDNELCLRAGYTKDGHLLAMVLNLGFDPEESLTLYLEKTPESIRLLLPDGTYKSIEARPLGDSLYELPVTAEPMYPVVLLIK